MQKNTTDQINQLTLLVNGITLSIYFIINHRPSFMLASTLGLNKSQPTKCWQSHFSLFFIFVNLVNTLCNALVLYVTLHKCYKHLCIQILLYNVGNTTPLTTNTASPTMSLSSMTFLIGLTTLHPLVGCSGTFCSTKHGTIQYLYI